MPELEEIILLFWYVPEFELNARATPSANMTKQRGHLYYVLAEFDCD